MDQQQFENEVMQDLAAEAPPSSADEALDEYEAADVEGFEEEGMEEDAMLEEMDAYDGCSLCIERIGLLPALADQCRS